MKSIFLGVLAMTLCLSANAAQKNYGKKSKSRAPAAAMVINQAGDRSLKCGANDADSYEGDLRIRDVSSSEDGESFDIIYNIRKKNGKDESITATGRCIASGDSNSCYLSRVIDVPNVGEAVISGELYKSSNATESSLYMSHALGNRAAERFEAQCNAVPCVIDNFIKYGKLSGGGTPETDSCSAVRPRCCGMFVDQRAERWGTRTGSARIVNDDLTCNIEITDAQAEGKNGTTRYCVSGGVVTVE